MRRLLLTAGLLGAFIGPSFADPAITVASSYMRKAANPYSRVVQAVPANAQVDIQSCGGDWCYGSWRGRYGFMPSFAVAQGGPTAVAPAPTVVYAAPPPPVVVTAPVVVGGTWGWGWGHPYGWGGYGYWHRW